MAHLSYPDGLVPELGRLPAPLNVFRMVSLSPPLVGPAIDLGLAILGATTLAPRSRELVIMAVARLCDCRYEWVQHTPIALDAGVAPSELDSLARDEFTEGFAEPDRLALRAVRELVRAHRLPSDVVAGLADVYSPRQVVELVVTVGYYTMLAGVMNGLGVDVDPAGERFSALANGHR